MRQLDILVYTGRAPRDHLDSFFVEVEFRVHNFHDHVINLQFLGDGQFCMQSLCNCGLIRIIIWINLD